MSQKTLREIREELGLSMEEVAAALKVSYNTVRNWELGRSKPHPEMSEVPSYLKLYRLSLKKFIDAIELTYQEKKNEQDE